MGMVMNEEDCWQKAYSLHQIGKENEAVLVCEQEPCATNSKECQSYLGSFYFIHNSLDKSLLWFSKAIEAGDVESIFGLASTYYMMRDFNNAVKFHKKALDSGIYKSCYWLGYFYEKGFGVEKNREEAIKYFQLGSKHGFLMCERSLIYIDCINGTFLTKVVGKFKLLKLILKALWIAIHDENDERLAEILNERKKIKRK